MTTGYVIVSDDIEFLSLESFKSDVSHEIISIRFQWEASVMMTVKLCCLSSLTKNRWHNQYSDNALCGIITYIGCIGESFRGLPSLHARQPFGEGESLCSCVLFCCTGLLHWLQEMTMKQKCLNCLYRDCKNLSKHSVSSGLWYCKPVMLHLL